MEKFNRVQENSMRIVENLPELFTASTAPPTYTIFSTSSITAPTRFLPSLHFPPSKFPSRVFKISPRSGKGEKFQLTIKLAL
jgi:hypothetical protein